VFVPGGPLRAFCETLAQTSADAIAITGDISDGRHLEDHLSLIAERVEKPIFVLLGNHDRYHTSFAGAEEQVRPDLNTRNVRERRVRDGGIS
jgi:calcineurin-like phosphoesterase family protein